MFVPIIIFIFMGSFFGALFIGVLMAPSSTNEKWLLEGDHTKMEILQIPHIFLKRYYKPKRYYVRSMIICGLLGLTAGFCILYGLLKFGLV
jgi:hypothetical protein